MNTSPTTNKQIVGTSLVSSINFIDLANEQSSLETELNASKPWLNSKGDALPASVIARICQDWTKEVWESYLQTLERGQSELIFENPHIIDNQIRFNGNTLANIVSESKNLPHLKTALRICLDELGKTEYEAIKMHFLQNKSQSEIAREIGVHRSSINRAISRGLKKLVSLPKTAEIVKLFQLS